MNFFQKIFSSKTKNFDGFLSQIKNYSSKYITIDNREDCHLAYNICPPIHAIVDKKASLFQNFKIKEITKVGKEIEASDFLSVINNPHPLYSQGEFWQTISKEFSLYNEVFIFINRKNIGGLLKKGDTMLVLPAKDVTIIVNEDYNIRSNENNYIKHYEFNFLGKILTFQPYEILHLTATTLTLDKPHADLSLKSCEGAINSILSGYKVRNILQSKNGGFGIFTNDSKAGEWTNSDIENNEIEKLQKELKKYGFDREQYSDIITNYPLKYQPITFPLADMQLGEGFLQAKEDICDVMNYPILALNTMAGATFANMEISDKKIYSDSIIPLWNFFQKEFNQQNLTLNDVIFDYSDVSELLTDESIELVNTQTNDNIQINRYKNKIITCNEMRIACGLEAIAGGDYYFSEPIKTNENVI